MLSQLIQFTDEEIKCTNDSSKEHKGYDNNDDDKEEQKRWQRKRS